MHARMDIHTHKHQPKIVTAISSSCKQARQKEILYYYVCMKTSRLDLTSCCLCTSLCVHYFLTISLRAIEIEFSIDRLKFKKAKFFVVVIIYIRNALTCTNFNLLLLLKNSIRSTEQRSILIITILLIMVMLQY